MSNASVTSHHLKIAKTHIAELKAERDYYKTRYEKSADYARELENEQTKVDMLTAESNGMLEHIRELEAERDDYKARWEATGCTRHHAMETAIAMSEKYRTQRDELQARIDRAPEPTVNPITQRLRMRYMNWYNADGPDREAE